MMDQDTCRTARRGAADRRIGRRPGALHSGAVLLLGALMLGAVCAQGDSLFTSMYGDSRARRLGDTLHLLIVEVSSAQIQTGQATQQQTSSKIGPGVGKFRFLPLVGFGAKSNSTAKGSSTRSGKVTARMTVQVVEITELGNLVVQGQRTVTVNSDREVIRIRGEVRPKSIGADNTVYSYDLANVELDFVGSDPRKPGRKVGIITRLLNLFF